MDATVRFYHGLLGMRLLYAHEGGHEPGVGQIPRHYWFDCGGGDALHVFEVPSAGPELRTVDDMFGFAGTPPGRAHHLAFRVPDEAALVAVKERLEAAAVEVHGIIDLGATKQILFRDPTGNLHEVAYWAIPDPTTRPVDYRARGDFGEGFTTETDPPPAVRELIAKGRL